MPVLIWLDGESHIPSALGEAALPLGAVISVTDELLLSDVSAASLLRLAAASPWSPVVAHSAAFALVRSILPGTRVLSAKHARLGQGASASQVVSTDAPTLEDFVLYLESRLGSVRGALILRLFAEWCGTSTCRRTFRRHGLPIPIDWYDLWLAIYAQGLASPRIASESEAAHTRGVSVREIGAQAYRLFQMSWAASAALPWQARIEQFLRINGCCGGPVGSGVRRSRFNDVKLRKVGNRSAAGVYVSRD